jgi:integrase/recombinase XerC
MTEAIARRATRTPARRADLLADFFRGKDPKTIRAYSQALQDFRAFLGETDLNAAARVLFGGSQGEANGTVLKYKAELISRELSPATINQRLAAIRSLAKIARTLGLIPWGIEIKNVQAETYRDTRGPGRDAWEKLLAVARGQRGGKALRDVALLRLMHDLGLRRAEVARIDFEDVDLAGGTVFVLRKKHLQKTLLTMPGPTIEALEAWMEARAEKNGPVFVNFDRAKKGEGERLTDGSIYRTVRSLGEKIGIQTRPHGLRHLAITEAVKAATAAGIGLEEVRDFSGHKDVKTLLIYRDRERNVQGQLAALVAAAA